ncbi:hypothetical protein [Saccharothrix variisporea]|uniref:Phage terminase large subunit-like protein n=1 Tax=Saccharothrix variisporea TaxID=543527 RepID=A0A495WZH4_9PSEU|nr:hypothetical protein [Saccharothrix variisporea]RKT67102.1 hypothetical protein DFJ66_0270 [Saccharothrix variisporea]
MIEPAHFWMPPRLGSYGDEAIELAEEAGLLLDDEQKLAVDALLSYGPGGQWVALEQAVVEARQNGKTSGVLEPVTAFDFFLLPPDRMVWTAHLFKTAMDAFADFDRMIETSSTLSRRVKNISRGKDDLHFELHNGAKLEFLARAGGGGRGLKGKRIVMDEALILSANSMGALLPILSTRKGAQVTYGSSAGKVTSDHLATLVARGRKGGDPSLIWVEWCAPGSWDAPPCELGKDCPHVVDLQTRCALDDEELWPHANHSIPARISYEYVRAERRALPPREFGRERLGWHEAISSMERPIAEKAWGDLVDITSKMVDPVAVGLHVNNDRSATAIAVAGYREDGLIHLEVIKSAAGVAWAVADVVKVVEKWLPCAVVLDDKSETASLLSDFKEAGLKVRDRNPDTPAGEGESLVTTWAADLARACGALHTRVTETKGIRHLNQPELNDSIAGAAWRQLSNAKAWDLKAATTNQAPLMSVTLALHGLLTYGPAAEPAAPWFSWG